MNRFLDYSLLPLVITAFLLVEVINVAVVIAPFAVDGVWQIAKTAMTIFDAIFWPRYPKVERQ